MRRAAACFVVILLARPLQAADFDPANHPENRWVQQSPRDHAPAPRFGWEGSGSYDPYTKRWIHQGGHDGIPQGFHLFTFDLVSGKWQQHFPANSPAGVCCVDGANVFDLANRRFVRFPGGSLGHGYQWSRGVKLKNSHVWLYDPVANAWMNMRPAPYQAAFAKEGLGNLNASATYDAHHELAISFGGQTSGGGTSNLFAYDAYANQLHKMQAADPPSARDGAGLCYDAANDCLVMFGSQYSGDEKTYLYRFATNRWEAHDLNPRPVGKKLGTYSTIPKMAYDSLNRVCLCITWDTNANTHETWALDAAKLQWTKLSPAVEADPSMSRSRNLSYAADLNLFILETSAKMEKGSGPQMWTYRYKNVPPAKSPAAPSDLRVVTEPGQAALTWTASPGAKEYQVLRAQADKPWETKFEKVGTAAGTSFTDKGLEKGKVYFYQVKAVSNDGLESPASYRARTQPRVLIQPVVSVLAANKVEVNWNAHPAKDVVGYHVYRGLANVRSIQKSTPGAWKDNDPDYAEPTPVEVRDITEITRLTGAPLAGTSYTDAAIDLAKKERDPAEYKFHVYAYIIRAVNQLGVESGPSPYALTIPSEPAGVLNRENGKQAELKWQPNPEKAIAGYRVYKLEGTWGIVRLTPEPIKEVTFKHDGGSQTRYWITAIDALGQEGQPSSPVWHNKVYKGFFEGEWHQ